MLLTAKGHSAVYVSGPDGFEPRAGNPYNIGWYRIPVLLKKGMTDFLFHLGRGSVEPGLVPVEKPVFFSRHDHTTPDLIVGEPTDTFAGIVVVNVRPEPLTDARILITGDAVSADEASQLGVQNVLLPAVPAFGIYKACVPLRGPAPSKPGKAKVKLELVRLESKLVVPEGGGTQDSLELELAVRDRLEPHKRVYKSDVDGSAQYYAINPPIGPHAGQPGKALFLSLHGAGVQASGQARAYSRKSWGYLVAATNRRPYGFDWEDWGRLDAMDVLGDALARYPIDPSRVYLTGHSMGGHGTWQVAAHFPDRFAAIGPSAGWISFDSYTRRRRRGEQAPSDDVARLVARVASPSNTLALEHNYAQFGIYILHGTADRNVPIREARAMVKALEPFHHDFRIHEQAGAGHWWDGDPEPGAACVDFRPMFDFFARHRRPADDEVRTVDFTTVDPSISATCHWVRIVEQARRLAPSRVVAHFDPLRAGFVATTDNVEEFALGGPGLAAGKDVAFEVDGQELTAKAVPGTAFELTRSKGKWQVTAREVRDDKPRGPFKNSFRGDFVLVFGTAGEPVETHWARAKARFDAETFWYRGNGSVEVMSDVEFARKRIHGRNVIVYGNATTNRAWKSLLGASPVQVTAGAVHIGEHVIRGDDLACLLVRPQPADDRLLVAAVTGTGAVGMRLTDRLPYFVSGVHYPDVIVIGSDMLDNGMAGVRAAGLFGYDWSVENGEFAFR